MSSGGHHTVGGAQEADLPAELLEKRLLALSGEVERPRSAGFDEAAMHRWHVEFERENPQAHLRFLQSLGMDPAEIDQVRRS